MSPLDFELYDNGKLQKITEDATSHPISLVVAVQASANMEKLLPDIRKIGSLFSGLVLGETGEMAVLAFDHRVQTMTEFTSDPDKISNAFKNIKTGSTPNHVNDAAMKGVNMLRTRDKARRRILLLISETRDSGSSMGVRDVLTEAEFKRHHGLRRRGFAPAHVADLATRAAAAQRDSSRGAAPAGGHHRHADHRCAAEHGRLFAHHQRDLHRGQSHLHFESAGSLHQVHGRA